MSRFGVGVQTAAAAQRRAELGRRLVEDLKQRQVDARMAAAEARARVQALPSRVVADRLEHGEEDPDYLALISFAAA